MSKPGVSELALRAHAARIRALRGKGLTWQQVQADFTQTWGYGFSVFWLQTTLKKDDARLAKEQGKEKV